MKFFLLIAIRLYWILVPKPKRRECLFKKSCSHFVFDAANESGLITGLKAFWFRYRNCRSGFQVFSNPITKNTQVLLPSKIIVDGDEMSDKILTN